MLDWLPSCYLNHRLEIWLLGCASVEEFYLQIQQSNPIFVNAIIKQDPEYTYNYVCDIIKGPWPEGEDIIATDGDVACKYALDILKNQFPKGEKAIAEHPYNAYWYAHDLINSSWTMDRSVTIVPNEYWNRISDIYYRK